MHKSHIIFHINSWMSYFQFLGSEKAIMSEWVGQNTTFPTIIVFWTIMLISSQPLTLAIIVLWTAMLVGPCQPYPNSQPPILK